jgi:hypothetical protein
MKIQVTAVFSITDQQLADFDTAKAAKVRAV